MPLPETGPLVVGRDPDCDLPLPDGDVSRRHAAIERDGDGWSVHDLGSGNGTFVNGRRVTRRRLRPGDEVRFGASRRYRVVSDDPPPAWLRLARTLVRHEIVARDPAFAPRRTGIGSSPILVGRGSGADLRLPVPQVSDPHARLDTRGGVPWVHDTRSRNGTWVNGARVTERELAPGDEVAFSDRAFDVRLGRAPTARGVTLLALVALVAAAGFGTSAFLGRAPGERETLWTREMYEESARNALDEAVEAYDRSPPAVDVARARFDIAVRSLIAADRLRPDVQTQDEIRQAFARASRDLGDRMAGRDAYDIYRALSSMEARRDEPPDPSTLVERELARILAEFGIDTSVEPIPPDLLAEVERFVQWWAGPKRDYTRRALARAAPHLDMIRAELRANHLPEVFATLPFIESAYRADATSPAGARGMWQFVERTGRSYGLVIDDTTDQRTDPLLSTRAACRYIDGLLSAFGADAFMCAIAAYNKGEYGMVTCLKKISWRSRWKFWELVQRKDGCLKQETIEYVPRFLAAAVVMRRPEAFGLDRDDPGGER